MGVDCLWQEGMKGMQALEVENNPSVQQQVYDVDYLFVFILCYSAKRRCRAIYDADFLTKHSSLFFVSGLHTRNRQEAQSKHRALLHQLYLTVPRLHKSDVVSFPVSTRPACWTWRPHRKHMIRRNELFATVHVARR